MSDPWTFDAQDSPSRGMIHEPDLDGAALVMLQAKGGGHVDDLSAESLADALWDAEWFLKHYGFELDQTPSMVRLATKATRYPPAAIHTRVFEAYTTQLDQADRIFISQYATPARARWLIAHELAEIHHQRVGYVGRDVEQRCNAMASAMAAPRLATRHATRSYGRSVPDLARALKTPEAAVLLRIGEVVGHPCALLRPAGVVVRGAPFSWPSLESEFHALLHDNTRPDVTALRITDGPEPRWALMANAA